MDIIREHLMYKNSPLTICMKNLTCQEQYECIRVLLESGKTNISICHHNLVNLYIARLLKKVSVNLIKCSEQAPANQQFPV
jgi:hypothetical protein